MATKDFAGGAIETTLAADITSVATSATITASTGWPSGGANGTFGIAIGVIDATTQRFVSNVEKIRVTSRTGTTLSSLTRGIDGTSAVSHTTGETVRHILLAEDIDEANEHINNVGLDHHTQYHTAARHAAVAHTAAMLGTDSVGTDEIAASAVTSSELAANAVIAGKIATGGISAAAQFAAGVVDAAAIGADQVGSSEIAPLAVTSAELAANAVIAGKIASGGVSATAQLADAIVTLAKFASEASTSYDPNFDLHNVTIGSGGVQYGRYFKLGRLMFGIAGFALGTGGSVTGTIGFETPFDTVDRFTGHADATTTGWLAVGRCFQNPGGVNASSGIGGFADANPNVASFFITAGSGAAWDANTPFTWNINDIFQGFFAAEAPT